MRQAALNRLVILTNNRLQRSNPMEDLGLYFTIDLQCGRRLAIVIPSQRSWNGGNRAD